MSINSMTIENIYSLGIGNYLDASNNFIQENHSDSSSKNLFGSIADEYSQSNHIEPAKSNNNEIDSTPRDQYNYQKNNEIQDNNINEDLSEAAYHNETDNVNSNKLHDQNNKVTSSQQRQKSVDEIKDDKVNLSDQSKLQQNDNQLGSVNQVNQRTGLRFKYINKGGITTIGLTNKSEFPAETPLIPETGTNKKAETIENLIKSGNLSLDRHLKSNLDVENSKNKPQVVIKQQTTVGSDILIKTSRKIDIEQLIVNKGSISKTQDTTTDINTNQQRFLKQVVESNQNESMQKSVDDKNAKVRTNSIFSENQNNDVTGQSKENLVKSVAAFNIQTNNQKQSTFGKNNQKFNITSVGSNINTSGESNINAKTAVQTASFEQSATQIRTSNTDIRNTISQQITESIQASIKHGESRVVIRLNPPELGKVTIAFKQDAEQLNGIIQVSKNETRYEVENLLPGVVRGLQESGIQIKRLDIAMNDQSQSENSNQHTDNQSWSNQDELSEKNFTQQDSSLAGWISNKTNQITNNDPQLQVSTSGINMLV